MRATALTLFACLVPFACNAGTYTLEAIEAGSVRSLGTIGARPDNHYYFTGMVDCDVPQFGCGENRSFFTFDLSQIPAAERVSSAVLVLEYGKESRAFEPYIPQVPEATPQFPEELALFDAKPPFTASSFQDLGSGYHYGTFNIDAAQFVRASVGIANVLLPLNANGKAAVQSAIGSTFSLGGAITNIPSGAHVFYLFDDTKSAPHLLVETSNALPTCDLTVNGADARFPTSLPAFYTGDTVKIESFRLANTGTAPIKVDIKIWVQGPAGAVTTISEQDGVRISAGYDRTSGPITVAKIGAYLPRGVAQFGCRLLDSETGDEIATDLKFVEIH